jgi:hypothetical protein
MPSYTNSEVIAIVTQALNDKDTTISGLEDTIASLTGTPTTPTPAAGQTIVLQNMTLVNGVYRSNDLGTDQKCYVQVRVTSAPQTYAKLSCRRRTNVIEDGKLNLKRMRVFPDGSYPNDYVARSINTGASQFTTENPTATLGYFAYSQPIDQWQNESYEFFYALKKMRVTIGNMVWEKTGWNPGTLNRTQFGVQMVCANPTSSAKLPAGSYVEFDSVTLEVS